LKTPKKPLSSAAPKKHFYNPVKSPGAIPPPARSEDDPGQNSGKEQKLTSPSHTRADPVKDPQHGVGVTKRQIDAARKLHGQPLPGQSQQWVEGRSFPAVENVHVS